MEIHRRTDANGVEISFAITENSRVLYVRQSKRNGGFYAGMVGPKETSFGPFASREDAESLFPALEANSVIYPDDLEERVALIQGYHQVVREKAERKVAEIYGFSDYKTTVAAAKRGMLRYE